MAQKDNTNAVSHGVHSYLATGKLPPGSSNIDMKANKLKASLLAAVQECHGHVSVQNQLLIHSAVRHEVAALLIQKWLADSQDKLSNDQRINHVKSICNASDARDRAVKALALDRDQSEGLRTLYQVPTLPDDAQEPAGDLEANAPPNATPN